MNPVLPDEAITFAAAAARAFADLGGTDLMRRAEHDASARTEAAEALARLGLDGLDPRSDATALAAAAACCAEAGRVALPYPLAAVFVRDGAGRPTAAVPAGIVRADHGDLFPEWAVGSLDGTVAGIAAPAGAPLATRLGPFVGDLRISGDSGVPMEDLLCQQVLIGWTVVGGLEAAVSLATSHVAERIQFGKPLASFQAVQFQLADAAVAVAGLRELAGFALWRWSLARAGARTDVFALRLHAIDTARVVLRICQQLHGAAGVCDEYDVSVITRTLQPALRLPAGAEQTADLLWDAVSADGFEGLFPHGGRL